MSFIKYTLTIDLVITLIQLQNKLAHSIQDEDYHFHGQSDLTWYDAALFCQNLNMRLLSIESDAEFDYVRIYLDTNYNNSTQFFWTSGVDLIPNSTAGTEGQIWTDSGKKIESHYWAPTEPGDVGGILEMCVSFHRGSHSTYALHDQYCLHPVGVICKTFIPEPCLITTSPEPCPECPTTEMPTTCPSIECPTCAAITSCPSTTTTDKGPSEFICEAEGQFPDLIDCHVFHVCTSYNETFIDDEFTCPDNLVYCPDDEICDYSIICPCFG